MLYVIQENIGIAVHLHSINQLRMQCFYERLWEAKISMSIVQSSSMHQMRKPFTNVNTYMFEDKM